jgi:TonB-dependent SusC/RagA subfamily outer membrane receptor
MPYPHYARAVGFNFMYRKSKILIVASLLLACIANVVYGQKKSDLYIHVDSVIVNKLTFNIEANKEEIKEALAGRLSDSTSVTIRCVATIPGTEKPLILLNLKPVELEELNKYRLANIKSLEVVEGARATALYGVRGANGVIVIYTKKKKEKL